MKAISSKLNMYVRSAGVINNDIEKTALNLILGSFGALALLYVFFLGNMVMNIVERKGLEAEARLLSSEVRNLELTYLSMSNQVDLSLSYSLGFKDIKANFAARKSLGSATLPKIVQNDL
ncbi:MAG: hypothetical protein AAB933_02865 [Patescibacteria group bacterium]